MSYPARIFCNMPLAAHLSHVKPIQSSYHPRSLSMYGYPSAPYYSSVWGRNPPATIFEYHHHGNINGDALKDIVAAENCSGYFPLLIAAASDPTQTAFGAIFQKATDLRDLGCHVFLNVSAEALSGLMAQALGASGTLTGDGTLFYPCSL